MKTMIVRIGAESILTIGDDRIMVSINSSYLVTNKGNKCDFCCAKDDRRWTSTCVISKKTISILPNIDDCPLNKFYKGAYIPSDDRTWMIRRSLFICSILKFKIIDPKNIIYEK